MSQSSSDKLGNLLRMQVY